MSLATGPDAAAMDSAANPIEPVVMSLDEKRAPVVAAAKERLLTSFRTRSRDPSPVRTERSAAPAMPNFEAWHGPPAASTALNPDVAEPAGLTGAGAVPPPSGVSGAGSSMMMPRQPAVAESSTPPPPSRTVVLEPAPMAMGVPAPSTPPPAVPTPPAPQPEPLTAPVAQEQMMPPMAPPPQAETVMAPEAQTRMTPTPSPLPSQQPESFTMPEAWTQAPVGVDDQSDAQLEQGLASSKMNDFMGASGDAVMLPSDAMQPPHQAEGKTASKVPEELVMADEEDGGVMRSHSSFTFDTPPPAPAPATSEEVAPLLGSSAAPKSAPEVNSYPLEPADTSSSDLPQHAPVPESAATTPLPVVGGGNGGTEAAREGYVLLGSDSAPAAGSDVTDSAVPPQESMNTAGRNPPPAIEPMPVGEPAAALMGAAPGLMLHGAPLAAYAPDTQAAGISTDEPTATDAAPVAAPMTTSTLVEGHPLPPALAADSQGASIAADEPAAVEAAPAAASALADTEPMAPPPAVPAAGYEGTATPALDLGQEPAIETDVADAMGLRAGATPVKGGPDTLGAAAEVEQTDAPTSAGADGGDGQRSHITASTSDEIALLKKRTHETAVAYRSQAVDVTHNKLKLRRGSALGTSTAIVLRGLATLAAYLKVLLIAIVLGLLRGIWFLAVQTTRFTASADAAAPADAPQDIIASKVHKASKVTADAVANAAEAAGDVAKLHEE